MKVKELETKLREKQESESASFQNKVLYKNFKFFIFYGVLLLLSANLSQKALYAIWRKVVIVLYRKLKLTFKQVKELENKLKEQVQESESRSFILQQKVVNAYLQRK